MFGWDLVKNWSEPAWFMQVTELTTMNKLCPFPVELDWVIRDRVVCALSI